MEDDSYEGFITSSMIGSFLKNISSPKQYVLNMISKDNPMLGNLINMAQNGNTKDLEKFARNFCNERNINFDTEFAAFMKKR